MLSHPCAVFSDKFEQWQKPKDQLKLYCIRFQRQSLALWHEKSTSGYEHDAGHKEYIWTVYMCTVFRLMINLCKIRLERLIGFIIAASRSTVVMYTRQQ